MQNTSPVYTRAIHSAHLWLAGVPDGLPAGALQADSAQQQRQQQRGVWHACLHSGGGRHQPHALALRAAGQAAQRRACHAQTAGDMHRLLYANDLAH